MAPPESVPRIQESDELAEVATLADKKGQCVLLQVGSERCKQCPAFTQAVTELAEIYEFQWVYCDVDDGGDIPETHAITGLPAVVIVRAGKSEIAHRLQPEELRTMVRDLCAPKELSLNFFSNDF